MTSQAMVNSALEGSGTRLFAKFNVSAVVASASVIVSSANAPVLGRLLLLQLGVRELLLDGCAMCLGLRVSWQSCSASARKDFSILLIQTTCCSVCSLRMTWIKILPLCSENHAQLRDLKLVGARCPCRDLQRVRTAPTLALSSTVRDT